MTVLVTGASGGIGSAVARAFLERGFDTVLNYNKNCEAALALEAQFPAHAAAIAADVRDHSAVKAMFEAARRLFGQVDILVNCAGVDSIGCFQLLADEELDRILDTNIKGTYFCCEEAFRQMNAEKKGIIINISSIWGVRGASCEAAYSASKAAVIGLTQALADELAPSGIRVNCIAPGVIDTPMNACLDEQSTEQLRQMTPLGRIGTAEDVVRAVLFLSGEDSSFITGQTLTGDGGFLK